MRLSLRCGPELNQNAAGDLGNSHGEDDVMGSMSGVGVMPDQRDEARGQRRQSKHMAADI